MSVYIQIISVCHGAENLAKFAVCVGCVSGAAGENVSRGCHGVTPVSHTVFRAERREGGREGD